MPEIITCPDCGRKLRVPAALVGKKVKCPDCNTKFTGGITTAPAGKTGAPARSKPRDDDDRPSKSSIRRDEDRPRDRDDDEDYPRRRRRPDYDEDDDRDDNIVRRPSKANKRAGWKMTLTGLNLLCYATYVYLGSIAVLILGACILGMIGAGGVSSGNANFRGGSLVGAGIGIVVLYGIYFVGQLVTTVLQGTGHGFCMTIPPKEGSPRKAMAIATFSCFCAIIVFYLLSCGVNLGLRGRAAGIGAVLAFLPLLIAIGYFICYGIFLRGVALDMREPGLAQQVLYFMIAVPVIMVLSIIMGVLMVVVMGAATFGAASSSTGQGAAANMGGAVIFMAGCGLLFLCIAIGMVVWYILLVHQLRKAVKNYVG